MNSNECHGPTGLAPHLSDLSSWMFVNLSKWRECRVFLGSAPVLNYHRVPSCPQDANTLDWGVCCVFGGRSLRPRGGAALPMLHHLEKHRCRVRASPGQLPGGLHMPHRLRLCSGFRALSTRARRLHDPNARQPGPPSGKLPHKLQSSPNKLCARHQSRRLNVVGYKL